MLAETRTKILNQFSIAELEDAVDDRKKLLEKPQICSCWTIEPIEKVCEAYIDYVFGEEYHEDHDWYYNIFETVVTTLYGKDVWDKIIKATD